MAILIDTPEQEIQLMIGKLIWDNTAQRHRIETLERELETNRQGKPAETEGYVFQNDRKTD